MNYNLNQIGVVKSCFKGKFGTPRQPGISPKATATLILETDYSKPEMLTELIQFSHLWVIFLFHETVNQGWKPTVRPPRLGGNAKMGLWATRSNFRPNPIGMSVVKIEKITFTLNGNAEIHISNHDLIENTPILDIKPYLPYADSISEAKTPFEKPEIDKLKVEFEINIQNFDLNTIEFIIQIISLDPRPAFHENEKTYQFELNDYKIGFYVKNNNTAIITNLEKIVI